MVKKKVIIQFDQDAIRYEMLLAKVEKAGFEVRRVTQLRKAWSIANYPNFFTDCVLIIMEPVHFLGFEGVPHPKDAILCIRRRALCKAPIMFFTLSSKNERDLLKDYDEEYGVVNKVLKKSETSPQELVTAIKEILDTSKV